MSFFLGPSGGILVLVYWPWEDCLTLLVWYLTFATRVREVRAGGCIYSWGGASKTATHHTRQKVRPHGGRGGHLEKTAVSFLTFGNCPALGFLYWCFYCVVQIELCFSAQISKSLFFGGLNCYHLVFFTALTAQIAKNRTDESCLYYISRSRMMYVRTRCLCRTHKTGT